jgi:hypothetical protein
MVKPKNSKANGKPKNKPNKPKQQPAKRPAARGLDGPALEFARLLADPCNAKMVHPVYSGTGAGILTRFESDVILNNGATETCAYVAFCPAALNTGAGSSGSVSYASAALVSDATVFTPAALFARQPGFGMVASISAYRVVSACLQISYPGSELSRAGIASLGQSTYAEVVSGTQAVASLRQLSSTVARTPDGELEIILRPTVLSEKFVPIGAIAADSDLASQPTLFASMAGLPVNTGMRVRMVVVYEWIPAMSTGCVIPETAGSKSNFTLTNVINFLDNKLPHWSTRLLSVAAKIAPAVLAF